MRLNLFAATANRTRRPKVHRATLIMEDLEGRLVLNAAVPSVAAHAAAHVQAPVKPSIDSLVQLTNFTINSVSAQGGQLVASATATLNVLGHEITRTINNIPLTLTGSPATSSTTCDVLNLTLAPVNLSVLGLNVSLDNCAGGPITVSITGNDAPGNLLGNLVCDVAGLLDNGGLLGGVLGGLSGSNLSALESGLTGVLNGVIGQLLSSTASGATAAASPVTAAATPAGATDILNLHLDPIHLNLLGLEVDTSAICLDVNAQPGPGNLLGNLLGSLTHLLDNSGNNLQAITVLERNILRVLGQLA
jgi:hypothetical protein